MLSRIALISLHASPLDQAGRWNAGGLNVYVRALSTALARQDLQVDIFTRRTDAATPAVVELAPGVRVIQVDAGPLELVPPDDLLPFVPLFTAGVVAFAGVHGQAYDVVHSHYWLSGLSALRLRRRWRVPAVHMFHTLAQVKRRVAGIWAAADQRRAVLEQEVLTGMDAIVAANTLEAAQLRRLYDGSGARIYTIPCGVDLALFTPGDRAAARRALGLPACLPLVFAAARIEPLKDLGTAIRAVGLLSHVGLPDAYLVIAGGPVTGRAGAQEEEWLRSLATQTGLSDRLRLVGAVAQRELPRYIAAADAVIVPSLYESFGMAALEALACGRPVIASATGGLQLTVHDGENGFLAPAGDAAAFADRLAAVLRNPVLAQHMSLRARRSAEPYSWTAVADRTRCLYESLVHQLSAISHQQSASG
jgi:D-inositol-3-phosphate glycosyltransferase